jgi:hypothetical protein
MSVVKDIEVLSSSPESSENAKAIEQKAQKG